MGEEFGKSWLLNFGNKNVIKERGWSVVLGIDTNCQVLIGGRLEPLGTSTWFYPSFLTNETPIILNRTSPTLEANALFSPDFNAPYFMDDPWTLAQIAGRPPGAAEVVAYMMTSLYIR